MSAATVMFEGVADFEAMHKAEEWCRLRGISVGRNQRGAPRGLLFGEYDIQKWRNLGLRERLALDGDMAGDMRHGPVTVTIYRVPTVGSAP